MKVKLQQLALNSFFIILIICFHDLQVVDHSAMNKMNSSNLAIVFGPNLLWPKGQASLSSMGYLNNFARLLIDNYSQLFDRQQITYHSQSSVVNWFLFTFRHKYAIYQQFTISTTKYFISEQSDEYFFISCILFFNKFM